MDIDAQRKETLDTLNSAEFYDKLLSCLERLQAAINDARELVKTKIKEDTL